MPETNSRVLYFLLSSRPLLYKQRKSPWHFTLEFVHDSFSNVDHKVSLSGVNCLNCYKWRQEYMSTSCCRCRAGSLSCLQKSKINLKNTYWILVLQLQYLLSIKRTSLNGFFSWVKAWTTGFNRKETALTVSIEEPQEKHWDRDSSSLTCSPGGCQAIPSSSFVWKRQLLRSILFPFPFSCINVIPHLKKRECKMESENELPTFHVIY